MPLRYRLAPAATAVRDLARESHRTTSNGHDRLALEAETEDRASELTATDLAREVRAAKRDQTLASIAVMLWDTAKALEPVIEMLSARMLRWAALGVSSALAFVAMRPAEHWERLAVLGAFMLLAPWIVGWRK